MANFSDEKIQKIWEKAIVVDGQNPNEWRKDICGAWINRGQYGQEVKYGWEIDHVYPESKGGNHDIENLRPMYWESNRSKADDYPTYKAVVKSDGNQNVRCEETYTVQDDLQKLLKQKFDLKNGAEVFNEIHKHLQNCSGKNWSDYYVGTSDKPKEQLTNFHKVPIENSCWIYRKALSENDAFLAKKSILEKGAKGKSENNEGLYVYCYQITNSTKE